MFCVRKCCSLVLCVGMLRRWDDSQRYLSDNPDLVCEETANYLVIMCIDLEVEEVKSTKLQLHFEFITPISMKQWWGIMLHYFQHSLFTIFVFRNVH